MKNMLQILVFAIVLGFSFLGELFAAKVNLQINHKLGNEVFEYNKNAKNNLENNFELNRMEYYLSDFTIIYDGGQKIKIDSSFMLISANPTPTKNQIIDFDLKGINPTKIEGLEFGIGVPAPYNNQDPTKWASSHPLAPKSPSMHWGWSSGYRFVALEGAAGLSKNSTIEIHSLFNENYSFTTINTNQSADANGDFTVVLDADYIKALDNIDVSNGLINHNGDLECITLLNNFKEKVFTTPLINTIEEVNSQLNSQINIFPNPNNGNFNIDMSLLGLNNIDKSINNIKIFDNIGKFVKEIQGINSQLLKVSIEQKGSFVIGFYNGDELLLSKNVVVE